MTPWTAKLKTLRRIHLKGRFFRMVRQEDEESILSAGASFALGGRYNKAGEFGAVYLSEDLKTCELEKLRQVGNIPELLPPQIIGTVDIDISNVLDLTNSENLTKLKINLEQLTDLLDLTLPQALAEAARALGINALLVQSAAGSGKNLVIFEDAISQDGCRLKVVRTQDWRG